MKPEIGNRIPCPNDAGMGKCCSYYSPCAFGEGGCDDDIDCADDLVCGLNNCGAIAPFNGSNCCTTEAGNILSNKDVFLIFR